MKIKLSFVIASLLFISSCASDDSSLTTAQKNNQEFVSTFSYDGPIEPELKIAQVDPDVVADSLNKKADPNYPKVHPKFYNQKYPVAIMAHRGYDDRAPENTLTSFRKAYEIGANMIELDVHLTKDGEVVVMHDTTLDRTTTGNGEVKNKTLDELKQLDAGIKFNKVFQGEKIPTLDEVLAFAKDKISVNIEIKSEAVADNPKPGMGIEEKVVNLVKKYNMEEYVMVSAFKGKALKRVKSFSPKISTGLLMVSDGLFRSHIEYVSTVKADAIHEFSKFVSKSDIAKSKKYNIRENVWTVNDPNTMSKLIDRGVSGLITDRPDLAIRVLQEKFPTN
ncbi:MAG: glycerophosphodiester phosphodiesterase [Candidatus Sericytochromatia bacterium]